MQPLILCTFLVLIAALKVSGTSKKVLDFLSYVNGDYDNKEQTQKPGNHHAFVQLRSVPVDIPCLRPNTVSFAEQVVNGVIKSFSLEVIKDGVDDTVSGTSYNFTDYSKYKPREFNVENLSNFSCGDLQGDGNCFGTFRVSSEGFVFGNIPQCSITKNETHPRYTSVCTCDSMSVKVPFDPEPYEFKLTSEKYPLINPPNDYVAPCGN